MTFSNTRAGRRMIRRIAATVLTVGSLALVTACSAPEPDEKPVNGTEAAQPTASAADVAWASPVECTTLDLTPGATLDGQGLGACVQTALSSYGSGRESIAGGTGTGEIVFRYTPRFEFQGTLTTSEGDVHMTFIDDSMWIDRGAGWIRGDVTSEDLEEQMAGVAGELYRVFSDPSMAAEMIGSSPTWVVGPVEDFPLGDGTVSSSHRITSSAGFSWNEIPISQYSVWFEADWTPTGSEATIQMMGISDTTRQTYYDLGEPVEITPVG
ncbi:hypothetical protein ACTU6U_14050 [Microbacterium sp. A196]|uniref:hypothetical protein n=1 Tax=unclassified Microbacterium TaxID=2609290 RepID=UPI003FD06D7A